MLLVIIQQTGHKYGSKLLYVTTHQHAYMVGLVLKKFLCYDFVWNSCQLYSSYMRTVQWWNTDKMGSFYSPIL